MAEETCGIHDERPKRVVEEQETLSYYRASVIHYFHVV